VTFGLPLETFTLVHILISLVGIVSGTLVLIGMLKGEARGQWTVLFLASTILTNLSGFGFPLATLVPSHVTAIISLVVLCIALIALYSFRLEGPWRLIYVVTSMTALYLNVFVLIAQAFLKIPALNALAPTGSELPVAVVQGIVLLIFVGLTVMAAKRFHPAWVQERTSA
jgi:hypothetical protein